MEDAYAAGLIDGEGSITLIKTKSEFRAPAVEMSSTCRELLVFMKSRYGGDIVCHKTYRPHHRPSWSWKVRQDAALRLMVRVLPFLREPEKRRRALHLVTHYKAVTVRNGRYTEAQMAAKKAFEEAFFHPAERPTGGVG